MIQEWRSFLVERGAVFDGDQLQHFGHPHDELAAINSEILMTDLSFQGLIAVEGEDAGVFLQKLLTNDVQEINEGHSQLTGLCNPKGRLLALFRLFQRDTRSYLICPRNQLTEVLKRLRMYVLRSQVKITDVSDHFCHIGLVSPQAKHALEELTGPIIPDTGNGVHQAPNHTVIRVPGEPSRFEIIGKLSAIQKLWDGLGKTATPVGANLWKLLAIRAGIATLHPETREAFIPQQVNLELTEGASLTKGCYPGQEVIARLHYRGKPSRRMFLVHIATDKQPLPGEPLYLSTGEGKRPTGEVVDAQLAPEGGYDSLVVLQLANIEKGDIALGSRSGPKLIFHQLPYPIPTQGQAKK